MDENINMVEEKNQVVPQTTALPSDTKFCQHCGGKIHKEAVICTLCGRQVEQMMNYNQSAPPPQVVINNTNANANTNVVQNSGIPGLRPKNKWTAFLLCLFFGVFGVHKFYEGKVLLGILYLFTLGLFGFGVFIDLIVLLFKPNPYFV